MRFDFATNFAAAVNIVVGMIDDFLTAFLLPLVGVFGLDVPSLADLLRGLPLFE